MSDDLESLPLTVVEAIRLDLSNEDAPYSISGLDRAEYEKLMSRNLVEALSTQPGVSIQKTANGQGSPYLRGFTGYRTLSTIDGIRYNNSVYRDGPNEYFSLIDGQSVNGFELVQGPGSVLYGSDAIGGTLNVQTKHADYELYEEGESFMHGAQSYRFSSAESSHITRTEASTGRGGEWGLQLGYSWKSFGDVRAAQLGVQPKTGYGEAAWDGRFDKRFNQQWKMTLLHQGLQQDDVWRTHSTIYGKSFAGTETGSDLRRLKDQKRSLTYARLTGMELAPWLEQAQLTFSLQTWDEDGERQRASRRSLQEHFDSRMWGIDLELQSILGDHNLNYGVDFYRDSVDSGRTDYNADGSLDEVRIQGPVGDDSVYDLTGVYAQDLIRVSDRADIILGGRYTYARTTIGRYEDPSTGDAASYSGDWHNLVGSIRGILSLDDQHIWKAWAGLSQSFRAPNVADISRYGGSRSDEIEIAATDLRPEKFLTSEIGIKATETDFSLSASYYYTFIDDYITSTPTGKVREGLKEVTKTNSSEGYIHGFELAGSYQINNQWRVFGNLTWMDGELNSFVDASSTEKTYEPISRLMPFTVNAALRWTREDDRIWTEVGCLLADKANKLSSRDKSDTQRIPPGGTPGYTLIHLRAGMDINDHLSATLALENILNQAYRTHGSGSNEPGFGIVCGFTARF